MAYTWTPPIIEAQDRACFYDHHGNLKEGICHRVETHYNARTGVAYHIYVMRADGHERQLFVGETQVVRPAPRPIIPEEKKG